MQKNSKKNISSNEDSDSGLTLYSSRRCMWTGKKLVTIVWPDKADEIVNPHEDVSVEPAPDNNVIWNGRRIRTLDVDLYRVLA